MSLLTNKYIKRYQIQLINLGSKEIHTLAAYFEKNCLFFLGRNVKCSQLKKSEKKEVESKIKFLQIL